MHARHFSTAALIASAALVVGIPAAFATSAPDGTGEPAAIVASQNPTEPGGASANEGARTLAGYELPASTFAYTDDEWGAIVDLWEAVNADETVSVNDLVALVRDSALWDSATESLLGGRTQGDLALQEARATNDLAAFVCNTLEPLSRWSYAITAGSVVLSGQEVAELGTAAGVLSLSYRVGLSFNSDPDIVPARAFHRDATYVFARMSSVLDRIPEQYRSDMTVMRYLLDDLCEETLMELPAAGVEAQINGQYTYRPAGTSGADGNDGSYFADFSTGVIPSAKVVDFAYPVNENGQTYGLGSEAEGYIPGGTSWEERLARYYPELVAYATDEGVMGYAYATDAFALLLADDVSELIDENGVYTFPVYEVDGATVIGSATMRVGSSSAE